MNQSIDEVNYNMTGWIKLHRTLMSHWCSEEPEALAVWVRLLMEANHSTTKKMFNGSLLEVKRGQTLFGLDAFSKKSGVSIRKLRRYLELFESEGMIDRLKTNKYSVISITCYEEYQSDDRQASSKGQADVKQTSSKGQHYKNVNNENNEKNVKKTPLPAEADKQSEDYRFAEWMLSLITIEQPDFKTPNLGSWSNTIRLMREKDKRNHRDMGIVWKWVRNDDFWAANVMSADKFRKQYDRLVAMTNRPAKKDDEEDRKRKFIEDRNRELGIIQTPPNQGDFIDGEVIRHD